MKPEKAKGSQPVAESYSEEGQPLPSEQKVTGLRILVVWLGAGFLFVLLVVGAYNLGTQKASPQQISSLQIPLLATPAATIDLTANWQTYEDTKYGYIIKYPPMWNYNKQKLDTRMGEVEKIQFIQRDATLGGIVLTIYSNNTLYGNTKEEYLNYIAQRAKKGEVAQGPFVTYSARTRIVDEINALEIDIGGVDVSKKVVFNKDGLLYFFEVPLMVISEKDTQKTLDIFQHILTSFRFVENISIKVPNNWKTYTTIKYGWVLQYPPNWYVYDKGFRYIDRDGKEQRDNTYGAVLFSPDPFPEVIPEGTEFPFEGFTIRFDPTKEDFESRQKDLSNSESLEIASRKAVKQISDSRGKSDSPPAYRNYAISYWIKYPKEDFKVLDITFTDYDGDSKSTETFDLILSTFRFVE